MTDAVDTAAPKEPEESGDRKARRVRIVKAGPMLVEGPVDIEMPDGTVVSNDRFMVAICTCKRSKNYPLCDTSHRRKARPSVERASQ